MAGGKKADLASESTKQLVSQLNQARVKLAGLKLDLSMHKLKDIRQVRKMRREIARILTTISQKNLEDQHA